MKRLIILFLLLSLITSTIIAQQEHWYHFYKGDHTRDIHETETDIWIGTTVGLTKIDKVTGEKTMFNSFNSDLPNSYIVKITEDLDGNIWVRTWLSVSKYDGNEWTHFTTSNSILEGNYPGNVYLEVDSENRIWMLNNFRVLSFFNDEWTVNYEYNWDVNLITAPNGDLWLRDLTPSDKKILKFDNGNWIDQSQFIPSNVSISNVRFQGFDSVGNLWSSVNYLDGYLKWDKISGGWSIIPLASNVLDMGGTIGIDINDHIWSYSEANGFVKFTEPNNWESFPNPNLSGGDKVGSISLGPDGVVWFTISNPDEGQVGLGKLNLQNEYSIYNLAEPIPNFRKIIHAASDGMIFMGGQNHEPLLFQDNEFTFLENGNSEIDSDLSITIAENQQGDVYTYSVINKLLGTFNFSNWNNQLDLPDFYNLTTPVIDNQDRIWVGDGSYSDNQGIFYFENNTWKQFDIQNELFYEDPIGSLSFDGFGNLWIISKGVFSGGLYKYDGTSFTKFNSTNSVLTNGYLDPIGQDDSGEIWVRASSQIAKFNSDNNEFEEIIDQDNYFQIFEPQAKVKDMLQLNDEKYYFLSDYRFVSLDENQTYEVIIDIENIIDPTLNQAIFRNMEKDDFGNIWIASSNGLYKHNEDSGSTIFDMFNSPFSSPVYNTFVDFDNNVWINTIQSGLYILSSNDQITPTIDLDNNNSISLYPNPVLETATIAIDLSTNEKVNIEIYDVMGRRMIRIPFNGSREQGSNLIEFSTNHLGAGIYFCKVAIGQKITIKKFVKN
ncbi:MAG: T9SS type A sorting domain-containing protein [Saprospiraceae bacterium]